MRKLFLVVLAIGLLAMGTTAFGLSFTSYTPTGFSSSSSFTLAPTGFGFGGSFASGCGDCFTLDTSSTSSTYTRAGWNGSISTATASAFVDTTICEDPCDDSDDDGVCDDDDTCPSVHDPSNFDYDQDGVGDLCDNCVQTPNPDQADGDKNGVGDACSSCLDTDGDRICNDDDNCPDIENPDQIDTDRDGIGDLCDDCTDIDNDTICDDIDPCLDDPTNECSVNDLCACENPWTPGGPGSYQTCIVNEGKKFIDAGIADPSNGVGCFSSIAGPAPCGSPAGAKCEPGHPQYDANDVGTDCPPYYEPDYSSCFE